MAKKKLGYLISKAPEGTAKCDLILKNGVENSLIETQVNTSFHSVFSIRVELTLKLSETFSYVKEMYVTLQQHSSEFIPEYCQNPAFPRIFAIHET